jgi:hypothetical protein
MVGGAGVAGNEKEDVKSSETSLDESSRDDQNCKKIVVYIIMLAFCLGEVQKVAHAFFKQNCFNDPDSEALLWECSWNKINEDKVVRSLYFNTVSLVFQNLAIN